MTFATSSYQKSWTAPVLTLDSQIIEAVTRLSALLLPDSPLKSPQTCSDSDTTQTRTVSNANNSQAILPQQLLSWSTPLAM